MKNKQQLITQYVLSAADLLKTSRHFVNIYQQLMHQNKKNIYAEFTGVNNRIKKYKRLTLGEWSHHPDYLGHEDLFCIVLLCILATSS